MLQEARITYKNLRDLRVGFGHRTVLYGVNGSGKTNLLEALAIAAGVPITLQQIAHRVTPPDPGAIALWFDVNPRELAAELPWESWGLTEKPQTWEAAVDAAPVDAGLKALLLDVANLRVRYDLQMVTGLERVATANRGLAARHGTEAEGNEYAGDIEAIYEVGRTFERTLCVPRAAIVGLALTRSDLPGAFAPLANDSAEESEWVDAAVLSLAYNAPLRVVWLSRERTDDELWNDYCDAIERAARAFDSLTSLAREKLTLLALADDVLGDGSWIARGIFTRAAAEFIGRVLPQVHLNRDNDWLDLEVARSWSPRARIGQPGDLSWITRLSSGERALVDEALLDADEALARPTFHAALAEAGVRAVAGVDNEHLGIAEDLADLDVYSEKYWSERDFDELVAAALRRFGAIIDSAAPGTVAWSVEDSFEHERLTMRVYDEPERHLHPGAQAALAEAIDARVSLGQMLVSTHSTAFLARDGWQHVHLSVGQKGVSADSFSPAEIDGLHPIAAQMGLRGGELLSLYRYLLFVEGPHDVAFLDGYCGAQLKALGVLVAPMFGADEVLQAAQSEILVRHLDVGFGVLLDHSRSGGSKESRLFDELKKATKRGRRVDEYRLGRPDILAYIADEVIRETSPEFPGFAAVTQRWKVQRGADYKQLVEQLAPGTRFHRGTIRSMAKATFEFGNPPADLVDVIASLAAHVRGQR